MRISDWSSDVCSSDLARDGAKGDLLARRGQDRQRAQALQTVTQLAWIAHTDWIARQPLDRLADRLTTDRARDDPLHIGDVTPVPSGSSALDVDIDIAPAGQPPAPRRSNTRYCFGHPPDIMCVIRKEPRR